MRQLVYKDLFFFRVTWLVNLVVPLVLFMLDPGGELLFSMSCLFITLSSVMTLIFMDERNKSDIVINSLPVSRKDIIIARYISCAIFIVGSIFSTMLVVFLIRGIVVIGDIGAYHPNLYIEIPWYEVINGAVYAVFFVVTFFPSYYVTKSKIARSIVSGVSMAVGGIAWIFIGDGLNETTSSFSNWIMNLSNIFLLIVWAVILVSVYIASMFLTIKIYGAHDL
ncbi:ABC-2 transporter permease [Bacillus paranthracis]|uniref:ABC-2 transporter permease n=1 Tax=Bacillus paranthracis TaxID=2026186 RepID=UPI001879AF46|nr:ABC-2 transporter permease [Bacillus paranthracis]MBE7113374.1 ABC-2 transporter permease [Bacillus paranthracis]MBE7130783.1 ABC-2 transporter permease [Bacillus paranthracis]MBE7153186.1 ABC-2 transporter permease [Bacillus paranthracis]MDK7537899.1 ABC-2 transporter permease [Bacillus paranthracis]MDK7560895.1 ABC-2 transporter permease [Bacillus paranthracis]